MKNLYLLRHAKSSWDFPVLDVERPLNDRGLRDAHIMGETLRDYIDFALDLHISYSKRTKDTLKIVGSFIQGKINSENITKELYTFDCKDLVRFIKNLPDDQSEVMIFGHNFAITDFVNRYGDLPIENVSTCGFVHLRFDIDCWQHLNDGRVIKKIFPKDLR